MVETARMILSKRNEKKDSTKSMSLCQLSSLSRRRRRRQGQKTSMLVFLTMTILLSFFMTLGRSDRGFKEDTKTSDEENDLGLDRKGRPVETGREQDSVVTTKRRRRTTVNIVDPTQNLPELLSLLRSEESRNRIWIVLAYRESCELSMKLLRKLSHHAIPRIEFNNDDNHGDNDNLPRPEMNFVPMPIDDNGIGVDLKEKILHRLGIVRLPSLFFLWDEEQDLEYTSHLENIFASAEVYRGRSESIHDLVNGLYHYLARLQLKPASSLTREEHQFSDPGLPLTAIRVESLGDLRTIIRNTEGTKILQNPLLPLDPDISEDDDRWIRYLMDDESNTTKSVPDNDVYRFDINDRNNDHKKHGEETRDPYHVVVQCRNNMEREIIDQNDDGVKSANSEEQRSSSEHSNIQLYQEYDQAIKVLGVRRDVLFSILEPVLEDRNSSQLSSFCNLWRDDGLVRVWEFHLNEPFTEVRRDDGNEKEFFEGHLNNSAGILDRLSSRLRPEVLWFDRRMTAPIAFHPRYSRHAILFVDLHDRTSASKTRDAIRHFRQECRRLKKEQQLKMNHLNSVVNQSVGGRIDGDDIENYFVCLIVPSTEIRVLNTFGIDIWSHLDRQATEKIKTTICQSDNQEGNEALDDDFCNNYRSNKRSQNPQSDDSKFSSVLPTLLVTDRRKDGTIQRHYLDPPITSRSLRKFVNDFVHGRTLSEKKSSQINAENHYAKDGKQKSPTNKHFINLLTAESLPNFLKSNQEKHVLVELYAPTCGHCKRFNIIWNSLGKLIEFLGWSDRLLLARIDVASNEIMIPGMAATWLPDVFYFGVGVTENPIHYGATPLADEVELGSISDPLDLLEWWMDEAEDSINESDLLHILDEITTTSTATSA